MKRIELAAQWRYLEEKDLATLNVGRGTIEVHELKTGKMIPHRLTRVQLALIKYAYERGLKSLPLY